jgi:hypothetical protein
MPVSDESGLEVGKLNDGRASTDLRFEMSTWAMLIVGLG